MALPVSISEPPVLIAFSEEADICCDIKWLRFWYGLCIFPLGSRAEIRQRGFKGSDLPGLCDEKATEGEREE